MKRDLEICEVLTGTSVEDRADKLLERLSKLHKSKAVTVWINNNLLEQAKLKSPMLPSTPKSLLDICTHKCAIIMINRHIEPKLGPTKLVLGLAHLKRGHSAIYMPIRLSPEMERAVFYTTSRTVKFLPFIYMLHEVFNIHLESLNTIIPNKIKDFIWQHIVLDQHYNLHDVFDTCIMYAMCEKIPKDCYLMSSHNTRMIEEKSTDTVSI